MRDINYDRVRCGERAKFVIIGKPDLNAVTAIGDQSTNYYISLFLIIAY